jgi:hypothetical protein
VREEVDEKVAGTSLGLPTLYVRKYADKDEIHGAQGQLPAAFVIERDVSALLAEYSHACGITVRPPIPVEEILESHLKLTLDFDDLHEKLGIPIMGEKPAILSALWVDTREVFIDQRLDPEEYPWMEGRFRFSIGHEIGHWRLHRDHLTSAPEQSSFFGGSSQPAGICRTSRTKEPVEWQANYYASCLLMPTALVKDAWRQKFGSLKPIFYEPLKGPPTATRPCFYVPRLIYDVRADVIKPDCSYLFDNVDSLVKSFASLFAVSRQAMWIKLEALGLLRIYL